MIKLHELKVGDVVLVEYEGQRTEGEIIELDAQDEEVNIRTEVQDFWYTLDQIHPIPVDDEQLHKFNFERQDLVGGGVKYLKGPFRILLSAPGNFSTFEMWYREDRRHITKPLYVHELQNHYYAMTKVHLTHEPLLRSV